MATEFTPFKHFRQFDAAQPPKWLGSRSTLDPATAERFFKGETLQNKLARALAQCGALPIKELMECGEMFERVRHAVRAGMVVDLCCGHGLLGVLFALFERRVERVVLIDRRQPPSHRKLMQCVAGIAPWVADKVVYQEQRVDKDLPPLPKGTSVVAAHACGVLTDRCLDLAVASGGAVAVMPCCYPKRACPAPRSLQQALGVETAFDIARTYRLEEAGYATHWSAIPAVITPMHRILIGRSPRA